MLDQLARLREAARRQRQLSTEQKNHALEKLAEALAAHSTEILHANREDMLRLSPTATPSFRDRLALDASRVAAMVESLRQVARLPDPVGEETESKILSNGLLVRRVRAPLGVIFMIFEARPNVILEAFSLAFKSGNVILLRGGSESRSTSHAIYQMMHKTLARSIPDFVPFLGLEDYAHGLVEELLLCKELIDIVVPRGGDKLIQFVQQTALMPIIKNDRGLCHTFVDQDADLAMALQIVLNAKTQRPGVCNAMETLLVHKKVAATFLPQLCLQTEPLHLQWRGDPATCMILKHHSRVRPAEPLDWDTEYLDMIMNCRIVDSVGMAMEHIERHGSRHSEAIVTTNEQTARLFQEGVDAAAVYWNASTRFTDGFALGLGGELGISTQKLHVRGPVGLYELTTPRWIIDGSGQIRG